MHSRFLKNIKRFLKLEAASGIVLFLTAIIAFLWANSSFSPFYFAFTQRFLFLINEGLMAFFFLVVGLELKVEFLEGELSKPAQMLLPAFAALGGMIVPAFIFYAINISNPIFLSAWATPVATDIAFALGVLSLFGKRIPLSLKIFLMSLAIFDDIGAIIIIAFFYSDGLSILWFILSLLTILCLWLLNCKFSLLPRRINIFLFLSLGFLLWFCLLKTGIHPTIAGILLALFIPNSGKKSLLTQFSDIFHYWVAYLIMPLFALANAGVALRSLSIEQLRNGLVVGIVCGLFLGKQIGVFGFSYLLIWFKFVKIPSSSTWLQFYGVCVLAGIGFTMSLFLGTLSFGNTSTYLAEVRIGVIIGSILSGLTGAIILLSTCKK